MRGRGVRFVLSGSRRTFTIRVDGAKTIYWKKRGWRSVGVAMMRSTVIRHGLGRGNTLSRGRRKMGERGWWTETKKMIEEGADYFWRKRGGAPYADYENFDTRSESTKSRALRGSKVSGKEPEQPK